MGNQIGADGFIDLGPAPDADGTPAPPAAPPNASVGSDGFIDLGPAPTTATPSNVPANVPDWLKPSYVTYLPKTQEKEQSYYDILKNAVTGIVKAGGSLLDLPQQALALVNPAGADFLNREGIDPGKAATNFFFNHVMPEYKPTTAAGKIFQSGAGGAATGSAFGPVGTLVGGLSGVASEGLGLLGDQANPTIGTIGRVGGSLIGVPLGLLGKAPPTVAPEDTAMSAAGIKPNADIMRGIELQKEAPNAPAGQFNTYATDAANKAYGLPQSPTQIGKTLIKKGLDWLDAQKAKTSQAYNQFEQKIGLDTTSPATATQDFLTSDSNLPPDLFNDITQKIESYRNNSPSGALTYGQLKDLRSQVGAATNSAGRYQPQLKQLYGAMTRDMEDVIGKTVGPEGVDAFNAMNNANTEAQQFIEQRMGKLSKAGAAPEQVFQSLGANPANTLSYLQDLKSRGVINDDDINLLARSWIQRNGFNPQTGGLDAARFAKATADLENRSPEAAKFIFGGSPAYDSMKAVAREMNSVNDPMFNANKQSASLGQMIGKALKKTALAVGGAAIGGQIPGVGEHAADIVGGFIGATAGEGAAASSGNALYRLAQKPWFARAATRVFASPAMAASFLTSLTKMHPDAASDLNAAAGWISGAQGNQR